MKNRLFTVFATVMLVFCSCLTACDSKSEFSELNARIIQLQQMCADLTHRLDELNDEYNESLQEKADLQAEIALLTAKLENLTGRSVEYTEDAPVYSQRTDDLEYARFDHHEDATVSFDGFSQYCRETFPEYSLPLWAPVEDEYDFHPNRYREYSVFAESIENNVASNPMFCERMMMYSKVLGDQSGTSDGDDGYVPWSVDLQIFSVPIGKEIVFPDIKVRFGEYLQGFWSCYANLYLNGECIATCYIRPNAHISQKWYENYFKENFVLLTDETGGV